MKLFEESKERKFYLYCVNRNDNRVKLFEVKGGEKVTFPVINWAIGSRVVTFYYLLNGNVKTIENKAECDGCGYRFDDNEELRLYLYAPFGAEEIDTDIKRLCRFCMHSYDFQETRQQAQMFNVLLKSLKDEIKVLAKQKYVLEREDE